MTAQIVTLDTGRHNEQFEGSAARILQGASWKKQRMVVLLPTANEVSAKVYLSHWNLIFPPNNGVFRMLCLGMEVGEAYSTAIATVLAHPDLSKWEYFLTIEHDNVPPQDGVMQLVESMDQHKELAVISGLYWTKGVGGVAQIWGDINDPIPNYRPQVPKPDQVQECYGVGMGFALWRMSMFRDEKLRKPWFKTVAGKEGLGTQDLYFWGDARKYGYRCAVDTRVRVGHYSREDDTCW